MAPKRPFSWKELFKFNRWFKKTKRRSSTHRTPSHPLTDTNIPTIDPTYRNQDRANDIARFVGRLSRSNGEANGIPLVILDKGNGWYRLLFESSNFEWRSAESYVMHLPLERDEELPNYAEYEIEVNVHAERAKFATIQCAEYSGYHPIQCSDDVTRNQLLYLFEFRFGGPIVGRGTVAFVDDIHIMFQATSECDLLLKGGLVFDGDMRLVGIVYSHAGSPKAVRISYIRRMLAERINHGGGAGPSSSSGGSSSRVL